MSHPVDVVAIITCKKGTQEAVKAAMKLCQKPSQAEPANKHYQATQDTKNDNVFVMLEKWESESSLQEHMQTPHFKKLVADISDKLEKPLDVHILRQF